MTKMTRGFALLLAFLLTGPALWPSPARAAEERRTVRVAYPIQAGLTDVDENGNYSGYTYEYLEELAQYTGWDYEFVQVSGTQDEQIAALMDMVKSGEVDLMGAMLYSQGLTDAYGVCSYGYGTVSTVLRVLVNGGENIVMDASRVQTLRIAVLSETGRLANDLNEFCQMNQVEPVLVKCDSEEARLIALEEGRADAILATSMEHSVALRTIASFAPRQFYFITNKEDAGLLTELNEAVSNINQIDPYFQSSLYEKYFGVPVRQLALTEEEKAYVQNVGPLRVAVCANQPPFQYRAAADGTLKGIGVDLLQYIAEETGLTFILIEAETQEELYEMVRDGRADLVAGMPYQYAIARERGLSMTRPYVSGEYILLLNDQISEENIKGKRLALLRSSQYQGYFVGSVAPYDTADECIRAVGCGEADYTYVDVYTAQYYLNLPQFSGLKMVPQSYSPYKLCYGLAKTVDRTLFGVLNKVVLSVPEERMQSIIYANTLQKQNFSLELFIRENPLQSLLSVASVFLLVLVLLLIILFQRVRAAKSMALELDKHSRLYAVSDDFIFEYDFKKQSIVVNLPESGERSQKLIRYDAGELPADPEARKSSASMLELLESEEEGVFEKRLYSTYDGQWHWFRVAMEKVRDEAGRPVYAIGRFNLIDEEKKDREALMERARRDSLTGLYNVKSGQRRVERALARLESGRTGALLLLDVDKFKVINDTYGHQKGDEVLRAVAELLRKRFREEDVVGRPGGDEFLVYMVQVKDRAALDERCAAICRAARGVELESGRTVTVSVGAALTRPGEDYETLYRRTDEALYAAKSAGRDGYHIAEDE